ncbi:ABC transporter ATP-binding protein [Sphingomonas sp. HF-S4]|uniref:ABC transporter ATP-binding protein n=1 Tax=Sphingomonas agrestis TaxID=3080540 RepID=A0ABU3Y781_9SPHN|nr:ABC transporter ATP-binding protein [Sphingomonas sp. HF-S4]MDV3457264.1 ABC transporter ATP-binding protein [Sphingomonas sp. HF-S4]
MRDNPVLEIAALSKTYGRRAGGVRAVQDVSLTVGAGEVYGFLGANGAGKSTTIRMLLGLISPSAGSIRLFGQDVTHGQPPRKVGSLVDGGAFYPFLTGRRNLDVLARTQSLGAGRIDALLDQVGLTGSANRKVKGYSTGMRQRLGVAAALLNDPDLVILDEPANGLDAAGIQEMRTLIRSLATEHGKTVFLSSHLLNEVQQVCDRIGIIDRGTLIREDSVAGLLQAEESLRIVATPLDKAQAALAPDWPCTIAGNALQVRAPSAAAPEILRRLVAAQVDVFTLAPHQRSLEEAFLAITSQAETGHA